jgi:hypothetical protein
MAGHYRPRYEHQQFNGSHVEKQARFHRDRMIEVKKTQELLKQIAEIAMNIFKTAPASYQSLHDHEQMNERLQDVIEDWKDG